MSETAPHEIPLLDILGKSAITIPLTFTPMQFQPDRIENWKIRMGCWDYLFQARATRKETLEREGETIVELGLAPVGRPTRTKWRFGKGWRRHVRRVKAEARRA